MMASPASTVYGHIASFSVLPEIDTIIILHAHKLIMVPSIQTFSRFDTATSCVTRKSQEATTFGARVEGCSQVQSTPGCGWMSGPRIAQVTLRTLDGLPHHLWVLAL